MKNVKILIVDDEDDICKLVKNALCKDGYDVTIKNNAIGLESSDFCNFDLILLDVMMPEVDGFSLCRSIRKDIDCPILFITAKTMEQDMIEGLSIGADDYIKKPFSIAELRARVAAHLRRDLRERHQSILTNGLRFDLSSQEIYCNDEKINLTKSEYAICEHLVRHKGQVFSLEHILESVFGLNIESDSSAVREHIKNIRSKLIKYAENPIDTIWGVGYRWK